jgi:hypothetical protein
MLHASVSLFPRRILPPALVVLSAVLVSSCRPGQFKPVFPVTGSVTFRGRPAEGVRVAFHPSRDPRDRGLCPQAVVAADGSFRLTTYLAGDGAPPGEYFVTLYWPGPGLDDDVHVRPDGLGGRYADPRTTPLTATVPAQAVVLDPFNLK